MIREDEEAEKHLCCPETVKQGLQISPTSSLSSSVMSATRRRFQYDFFRIAFIFFLCSSVKFATRRFTLYFFQNTPLFSLCSSVKFATRYSTFRFTFLRFAFHFIVVSLSSSVMFATRRDHFFLALRSDCRKVLVRTRIDLSRSCVALLRCRTACIKSRPAVLIFLLTAALFSSSSISFISSSPIGFTGLKSKNAE